MSDLPAPILNYLINFITGSRSPAYLLISKNGYLIDSGGNLEFYGITNLQKSELITDQIPFLKELLPLDRSPQLLPYMKVESGNAFDLHLFAEVKGDWVLLLDATVEELEHRLMQQRLNQLKLRLEKAEKTK